MGILLHINTIAPTMLCGIIPFRKQIPADDFGHEENSRLPKEDDIQNPAETDPSTPTNKPTQLPHLFKLSLNNTIKRKAVPSISLPMPLFEEKPQLSTELKDHHRVREFDHPDALRSNPVDFSYPSSAMAPKVNLEIDGKAFESYFSMPNLNGLGSSTVHGAEDDSFFKSVGKELDDLALGATTAAATNDNLAVRRARVQPSRNYDVSSVDWSEVRGFLDHRKTTQELEAEITDKKTRIAELKKELDYTKQDLAKVSRQTDIAKGELQAVMEKRGPAISQYDELLIQIVEEKQKLAELYIEIGAAEERKARLLADIDALAVAGVVRSSKVLGSVLALD